MGGSTLNIFFRGIYKLHPWSLTWNLRIHPWKRKIIFQTIIFKFYVKLQGHIQIIRHDKTRQTPPPWPRLCRVQHPTWRDHQRSTWRNSEKQRRGNPRKTKFPKDSFYDWMIFFLVRKHQPRKMQLKDEAKKIFNELILEYNYHAKLVSKIFKPSALLTMKSFKT